MKSPLHLLHPSVLCFLAVIAPSLRAEPTVAGTFKGDGKPAKLAHVSARQGEPLADKATIVLVFIEKDQSKEARPDITAGGVLTGDDDSAIADALVSRTAIVDGPDLDLGFNDCLQLRILVPASYAGDVRIEFGTTANTGFAATRRFVLPAASIVIRQVGFMFGRRLELSFYQLILATPLEPTDG